MSQGCSQYQGAVNTVGSPAVSELCSCFIEHTKKSRDSVQPVGLLGLVLILHSHLHTHALIMVRTGHGHG
jgi:hypothetical protein